MPVIAKFTTQIRDFEGFVRGPKKRVGEEPVETRLTETSRPHQEAHALSDLTSTEKAQLADLLEAEIAGL